MSAYQYFLETIPEVERINLEVDLDDTINILEEKMTYINNKLSHDFYALKKNVNKVSYSLDNKFKTNKIINNFDIHELAEEHIDEMIYEYAKIKQLLKKGREIRCLKELKEKEQSINITEADKIVIVIE